MVLVLDHGPIHTSRLTAKTLSQRPWLALEWLPKFAPELSNIERGWRDLKRHHLANQTFRDAEPLDRVLHQCGTALNQERAKPTCPTFRIAA